LIKIAFWGLYIFLFNKFEKLKFYLYLNETNYTILKKKIYKILKRD